MSLIRCVHVGMNKDPNRVESFIMEAKYGVYSV